MKRVTLALIAIALPAQASAAAAEQSCLTPAEGQALITSFLPDLIRSAAETCRTSLPADAFLIRSGPLLADGYKAESDRAWKTMRPILGKVVGKDMSLFSRLDDDTLRKVFASGVTEKMQGAVKGKDCATVSGVLEALEPLPPANMSKLIAVIFEGIGRDRKQGSGGFQICPPTATAAQ
jgi:hypothetical protein